MNKEQLNQEISDFNALIDRLMVSLERYLPKQVIQSIVNGDADKMQEHNKYVSFDTQVKCIAEQWNEDNVKRYEKIIRDHHAAQKLQQ